MTDKDELVRLRKRCKAEWSVSFNKGTVTELLDMIEDLQWEVEHHHQDAARWKEMADRATSRAETYKQALLSIWQKCIDTV